MLSLCHMPAESMILTMLNDASSPNTLGLLDPQSEQYEKQAAYGYTGPVAQHTVWVGSCLC